MAKATVTIVLFREEDLTIIAEVFAGERYYIPDDVLIYVGELEDFRIEYPQYKFEQNDTEIPSI